MIDNVNPTTQFHPHQPMTDTPAAEKVPTGGLGGLLKQLGIDRSKLTNPNVRGQIEKARAVARDNSGLVLGGLAALAIGAGLLRRRSMTPR